MSIIYNIYSIYINKIRTCLIEQRDNLKTKIKLWVRTIRDNKYLNISTNNYLHHDLSLVVSNNRKIDELDILTIAFNNFETIKTQYTYLRKYLKDEFLYIVVDNSTQENVALLISDFCKINKIPYVRLPNNPYNGNDPSRSHGMALNWSYKQLIANSKARYFGTIDHDIYPIKNTKIINKININKVWGHLNVKDTGWYMWPGFSFFDKYFLSKKKINFFPVKGLDTGGGNWLPVYSQLSKSDIKWPKQQYIRYRKGQDIQNACIEIIGDWLHLINASGWKDGKVKVDIDFFIKKILLKVNKV